MFQYQFIKFVRYIGFIAIFSFGALSIIATGGGGNGGNGNGGQQKPDTIGGIWQLRSTVTSVTESSDEGCDSAIGDTDSNYVSLSLVNEKVSGVDVYGTAFDGVIAGDDSFTLAGIVTYPLGGGVVYEVNINLSGQYNPNETLEGTIAITSSVNDIVLCEETEDFTAESIYRHIGNKDYSAIYGIELRALQNSLEIQRALQVEFAMSGSLIMSYSGSDGDVETGSFDANTGAFSIENADHYFEDVNGDSMPDLVCEKQYNSGLFLRDPGDTSGLPIVGFALEQRRYAFYSETDVSTCDNVAAVPNIVDGLEAEGYGKPVASIVNTQLNVNAIEGGGMDLQHRIFIRNPPLRRDSSASSLSLQVLDSSKSEVLCAATYDASYRQVDLLPHPDMALEAFQGDIYGRTGCRTYGNGTGTELVNGASYIVRVVDDKGTPGETSDDIIVEEFTKVAEVAFPVPTDRIGRDLVLNGVSTSNTEGGNLSLYGFFSPFQDMTASWPVVPTADSYRFVFPWDSEARMAVVTSSTNSTTIPTGAISPEGGTSLRSGANYDTLTGVARSLRTGMRLWPGANGAFNIETDHPDPFTGMFQIQMVSEGDEVACLVPNSYVVSCHPTLIQEPWAFDNAIDWSTSTITLELMGVGTLQMHFIDSGNATVTMSAGMDEYSGVARAVNPELRIRSQLRADGQVRTWMSFANAFSTYLQAVLTFPDGETQEILWDNMDSNPDNDFLAVIDSFRQLPFDDVKAQSTGLFLSYGGTQGELWPVGEYMINLTNEVFGRSDKSFRLDYEAPDPSALVVPGRSDITVNGITAGVGVGDNVDNAISVGKTLTVSWVSALSSDTRWDMRGTADDGLGNKFQHGQIRTRRLDQAVDAELSYNSEINTWTLASGPSYVEPGDIVQLQLRASDPAYTMQGDGAVVWIKY